VLIGGNAPERSSDFEGENQRWKQREGKERERGKGAFIVGRHLRDVDGQLDGWKIFRAATEVRVPSVVHFSPREHP